MDIDFDVEKFKMVLDLITSAGLHGKEIMYFYIGLSFAFKFLSTFVLFFALYAAYKMISQYLHTENSLARLCAAAGVYYFFNKNELDVACIVLQKYYEKEKTAVENEKRRVL